MRRLIQREIEDKLAEKMISDYDKSMTSAELTVSDGEFCVEVQ